MILSGKKMVLCIVFMVATTLSLSADRGEDVYNHICAKCHQGYVPADELAKNFFEDNNTLLHLKAPTISQISYSMKQKIGDPMADDDIRRMEVSAFIADYIIYPDKQKSVLNPRIGKFFKTMPSLKGKLSTEDIEAISNFVYDYDAKIEKNSNTLTISEHFFMKKRKIPKKEYKNFYKAIENIFNMDAWKVVLIKKANPNQSDILTKKAKSQKDFINLANYYIDKSNYQKAKELLEKALKRYPKSAKLHHLYGVVLGYMDMFDASDKEFEIAKKLGYKEEL